MRREWKLRVEDILDANRRIDGYLAELDFDGFAKDPRTMEAVAFNMLVLGEAATHVPAEVRDRSPEVPWSRMCAIRNVVAHEYFQIPPEVLYKTARENLPPLVPALEKLLGLEE